jgi:NTP pyrophosphatase (non-canonical NTP hydrolase)
VLGVTRATTVYNKLMRSGESSKVRFAETRCWYVPLFETAIAGSRQNIKEEMADILIYLVQMADKVEIDLEQEVYEKLKKNVIKYPIEMVKL